MAIKLVFLGKLADLAGEPERDLAVGALDWAGVLKVLEPALAAEIASQRIKLAVNGAVLADKTGLMASNGDEIALLPPVSGG